MGRRQPKPTPRGEAIRRLRVELDWSEGRLGKANGLSSGVLHNLESGWRKEPTRREAEQLIAPMELPPVALDMSDAFGRWVRAAAPPPTPVAPEEEDARRCAVAAGLIGLHVARSVYPALLRQVREERFARDRREANERCELLRRLPSVKARRERIENAEDYQTWALVERLAHESRYAAAHSPARAVEWAELALFTVRFVPGPESRRQRLAGWASFHLANAFRVGNDLDGSEEGFSKAWDRWNAGSADDFLPLDEGQPFDLEASLRREQRRFPEALGLHDRSLDISPENGRFLLNKAATLEQSGDVEGAVEALQAARLYIERSNEPRDLWVLFFNLAVNLWHLDRLKDAANHLSDAREVAIGLGNELDLIRTIWLGARIDAGLGRAVEATTALEQVFENLVAHGLPYDAALAGMDLAVLHLEEGKPREVMILAQRIKAVFVSFGIEREALSALLVFCEASRREEATVELARQTSEIIGRSQKGQSPSHPGERGTRK